MKSLIFKVERIVSGGQTGSDRGGLDAALALGIPCGGWCPKGRRAEDGVIPDHYLLTETEALNYNRRTEWNARDSDATLILNEGELMGGTANTVVYANKYGKPCRVVQLDQTWALGETQSWLASNDVRVLNVAGPRESKCPGIQARSMDYLKALLVQ